MGKYGDSPVISTALQKGLLHHEPSPGRNSLRNSRQLGPRLAEHRSRLAEVLLLCPLHDPSRAGRHLRQSPAGCVWPALAVHHGRGAGPGTGHWRP